jgi:hypothetical protein
VWRQMFEEILMLIAQLRAPPAPVSGTWGREARTTRGAVRLDERKAMGCSSRAEQPDDLAPNEGGCDRNSPRTALIKRKITPDGPGIWEMSVKFTAPELSRSH